MGARWFSVADGTAAALDSLILDVNRRQARRISGAPACCLYEQVDKEP